MLMQVGERSFSTGLALTSASAFAGSFDSAALSTVFGRIFKGLNLLRDWVIAIGVFCMGEMLLLSRSPSTIIELRASIKAIELRFFNFNSAMTYDISRGEGMGPGLGL